MLLDHFHPPLSEHRNWRGFHNEWATYLSSDLNRQLPPQWFASTVVEFGIEIDAAAVEESWATSGVAGRADANDAGAAWMPSAPHLTVSLPIVSDIVEIQVFHTSGGSSLVGAVELVSPRNKDRPESREAFIAKCESLVVAGIGLIVVDIVTERRANLHRELLDRLDPDGELSGTDHDDSLYAAAYHPIQRDDAPTLDGWCEPIMVGRNLPVLPLFLRGGPCIRVDLQSSYRRTCDEQRIPAPPH